MFHFLEDHLKRPCPSVLAFYNAQMATLVKVKIEQNIWRKKKKWLEMLNIEIQYWDLTVMKNEISKKVLKNQKNRGTNQERQTIF